MSEFRACAQIRFDFLSCKMGSSRWHMISQLVSVNEKYIPFRKRRFAFMPANGCVCAAP
jgi:hypothetical protein